MHVAVYLFSMGLLLFYTSRVHQPPPFVPTAVGLTDDGHKLPFGQTQVQVSAADNSPHHLVDLVRAVLIGELLQTALRGRAQRLRRARDEDGGKDTDLEN